MSFLSMFGLPSPTGILVMLGILAVSCGASFYEGHHYATLQQAAAVVKQDEAVIKQDVVVSAITADIGEKVQVKQLDQSTLTRVIIQKVPIYVTRKADSACVIPVGFVRLHNAAAVGASVSRPAGSPDGGTAASNDIASSARLSDVGQTVTVNYGQYFQVLEQLHGLQDWIRQQKAASLKFANGK
jgi:hypothetical protein